GSVAEARRQRPTELFGGLDLETREIALGPRSDPEGHGARGITELEIVHNQTGLCGAMDIQTGCGPFDRDAVAGPDARFEVHVALVFFRGLLARDREAEVRVRAVLRGMIAAHLVIGAAVGRPQIDVLELIVLKTEGDANEAARGGGRAAGGTPRQL